MGCHSIKKYLDQGEVWIHPGPLLKEVKKYVAPPQKNIINSFFY